MAIKAIELNPSQLSQAEWKLLGVHDAGVQKDARLCKLRYQRERFLNDAVHQASLGILREIQAAGSEVAIIGQNKLWKTGPKTDVSTGFRMRS